MPAHPRPDVLPITRELVDDLAAQAELLIEQLARTLDRAADIRTELARVRRELRRSRRRLV